jgi:predicted alpha/beta superfamily hydrolase
MNKVTLLVMLLIAWSSAYINGQDFSTTKTITIDSKELNQKRDVFIYTPPQYESAIYSSYNVIYVFDAQQKQFFDLATSITSFVTDKDITNHHIVVGIPAPLLPDEEGEYYSRGSDYLPKPKYDKQNFWYDRANSSGFMKFLDNELIPFVDSNYRTLPNRIFVGHSLSASFVMSCFVAKPHLANAYIAISPNIVYDKKRLTNEIVNLDSVKQHKFIYLSHTEEDIGFVMTEPALNKIEQKLQDICHLKTERIIGKSHYTSFLPGLINGFTNYYKYLEDQAYYEPKKIKIIVEVPNKEDEVFISGNHENLGSYQDGKIKLKATSELHREIEVSINHPAYIRFTGGASKSEAIMQTINLQEEYSFAIDVRLKQEYKFKIIGWK